MTTTKDIEKRKQAPISRRQETSTQLPATDIWETEHAMMMKLDMPGVNKDKLNLQYERNLLTIDGEIEESQTGNCSYAEYTPGQFHREFSLSEDLNPENINAEMKDGVLSITIGKREEVKPRKIAIKSI